MTLPRSLESVLMRTIMEARYEGVFRLLNLVRSHEQELPGLFDEDVPGTVFTFKDLAGRHAFKGQAFLPHLVYKDAQNSMIASDRSELMDESFFVDQVRRSLTQDNMTVISSTDVISGRRIPNERFEDIALRIIESKRNSQRKIERLPENYPPSVRMDAIVRSYMPPVGSPQGGFGTKTTITSAFAVGMWKMRLFVDFYKSSLGMSNGEDPRFEEFYAMMRESQDPVVSDQGVVLAQPHIVVTHASSYTPDAVSGLTRILGYRGTKKKPNRFGEFSSVVFQRATQSTLRTIRELSVPEEMVWTYQVPRSGGRAVPIVAVHRHYASTEPGNRPRAESYRLISPDDFGLDPGAVREHAVEKLNLGYRAPIRGELT